MTKTVYIPVTIKAKDDISDDQAIDVANSIVAMVQDGFFNEDNVFDAATEAHVELDYFQTKEAVPASSFVPRAE